MSEITKQQLAKVLPKHIRDRVTDDLIQTVNDVANDPKLRENFRENLLSYTGVLADGKFKIGDYVNAVKYVSYQLLGSSNIDAYVKTFPDRYQRLLDEKFDEKTISSFVSAYNKTQLVNKIREQTMIPTHILNADLFQKAINQQAYLMMNAKSEKVQSDAAACLIKELRPPETTKIEMDIGIKEDKSIHDLREATKALVEQQRKLLEDKVVNAKDIAESRIIEAEYESE